MKTSEEKVNKLMIIAIILVVVLSVLLFYFHADNFIGEKQKWTGISITGLFVLRVFCALCFFA